MISKDSLPSKPLQPYQLLQEPTSKAPVLYNGKTADSVVESAKRFVFKE